jgi:uncharacterized damage-inducible protein DinB
MLSSRTTLRHLLLVLLVLSTTLPGWAQDSSRPSELLHRYVAYNAWANAELAQWLAQAPDSVMEQEITSSFRSLRATVLHIWSAEYLWMKVLQDKSYADNPTQTFSGDGAELLRRWLEASAAFRDHVAGMDALELAGTRGGGVGRSPMFVADIIQHCMNHGTYHRGQLITMGRQAGLQEPPRTDFIHYVGLP